MKKLITLAFMVAFGISTVPVMGQPPRANVANLDKRVRALEVQRQVAGQPVQAQGNWLRNNKVKTAMGIAALAALVYTFVYSVPDTYMCETIMGPYRGFNLLTRSALQQHCELMLKACWSVLGTRLCVIR